MGGALEAVAFTSLGAALLLAILASEKAGTAINSTNKIADTFLMVFSPVPSQYLDIYKFLGNI